MGVIVMMPDISLYFSGGFLRPVTIDEVYEGYASGLNDPVVNRYLYAGGRIKQTLESLRDFVGKDAAADNAVLWGIWLNNSSHFCGTVRLHRIEYLHGTSCIGVCIFEKSAWGRHLGAKVIFEVTKWALEDLGLRWVEAGTFEENIPSQRAFLLAGYESVFDVPGKFLLEGRPATVKVYAAKREKN